MKGFTTAICLASCLLLITAALASPSDVPTIVPPEGRISDREARLALARILSYSDATLRESLTEYRVLLSEGPHDKEVEVETAGVLMRLKAFAEASTILRDLKARYPKDSIILSALADVECGLGHADSCRQLYREATQNSPERWDLMVRFAHAMNLWGDFYRAESIFRRNLADNPGSRDAALALARVLASSQRYEESEDVYRRAAFGEQKDPVLLAGLADTQFRKKDFAASEASARQALAVDPGNADAARILAGSLTFEARFSEARSVYEKMALSPELTTTSLVDIGKTFLKENNPAEARRYFERAHSDDPGDISSRFYLNWPDRIRSQEFLASVTGDSALSAAALTQWAGLYISEGYFDEATECLRAALARDAHHFPASVSLAEVLGANKRYDESILLYRELSTQFPDDPRLLIGRARVLAWSKRYDESIVLYRDIVRLSPRDPVPRREMARTAMWAKDPALAMRTYDEAISMLTQGGQDGADGTPSAEKRLGRSLGREKDAKKLAHDRLFVRALPAYESLLKEDPGNEEGLFDMAQVSCALGLGDREGQTYERLLKLDPLHSLALDSLERQKLRTHPSVRFDYSYWNEEGRGDLARITRSRFDGALDIPIGSRYHVFLKGIRWLEQPDYDHQTYGATGFSIGFAGVFTARIKGDAAWTHKRYDNASLASRDTGHGTLWFTILDRLRVGAGYARTDELYNYFGIYHGIQADRLWMGFQSEITRRLEVSGKAEYTGYTDSNSGVFVGLSAGYAFTDHPRVFKVALSGEYRDTRHDNEFIDVDGILTDIIHPYWTPRSYTAGSVTIEWYHDVSRSLVCGSDLHYYDLKASFGTDSENNPYARLEAEWNYEFAKRWLISVKGLVHSSPKWDATGLWTALRYRF